VRRKFELKVESKVGCLPSISKFIDQTMKQLKIQKSKDIHAVQLSVAEACTNVIQHAYSNVSEGQIVIRCMLSSKGNQLIVHIIDCGKSFDPTIVQKPDIDSNLDERREGGLGIFLIQKFMDNVKYTSIRKMNKLVMVKYLDN
jgi:serine/threonine-protein kinase RsbW